MTWYESASDIGDDDPPAARHRLASRWAKARLPGTQRTKAARRGAMVLLLGILVPLAVIVVHLAGVNDKAGPSSPAIDRQDHLWSGGTGLPPVPTTDPTELVTETPEPSPTATPTSPSPTTTTTTSSSPPPANAPPPPPAGPAETSPPTVQSLLVDNYDGSPGWSGGRGSNDLGNPTECEVFVSCRVTGGALVLTYNDDGWFGSHVDRSVSAYTYLVLRIRGEHGGEETHMRLTLGGVRTSLANLTLAGGGSPRITTSYQDLRIPMTANGMSRTNPGEFQLDFWHGGKSVVYIDEIRFE